MMIDTYALGPKFGVCNSPRDFFEVDEPLCSSLRLAPRPRPTNSFDILDCEFLEYFLQNSKN